MARVVVTHDVVDVQRWLAGKAERASLISSVGGNIVDTVALDGSNKIAITVDVDDLDAFQAMLAYIEK